MYRIVQDNFMLVSGQKKKKSSSQLFAKQNLSSRCKGIQDAASPQEPHPVHYSCGIHRARNSEVKPDSVFGFRCHTEFGDCELNRGAFIGLLISCCVKNTKSTPPVCPVKQRAMCSARATDPRDPLFGRRNIFQIRRGWRSPGSSPV